MSSQRAWHASSAHPLVALAVFGAALLVRLLYLASIEAEWFFEHLQAEPARYERWAWAIASGATRFRPPFDCGPAYPYFVAAIYLVAGRSILAVTVVQALLDSASCALVSALAARHGGRLAGAATGLLAAVYGPLVYFTGQLEPATLAVFAVALALWATPGARTDGWRWGLAGVLWALAILVRPELVLAAAMAVAYAGGVGGGGALLRAGLAPAVLLALSLAVNVARTGRPILLTTGTGERLWIGNNSHADGVSSFPTAEGARERSEVRARAADPAEADTFFRARVGNFLRDEPLVAARLAWRKLAWTFTARELPHTVDIEWQKRRSWVFRSWPGPVGVGIVFPLALAGLLLLPASRRRSLALLAAPVVSVVIVSVVFLTNARVRLIFAPSMLVLAGLALERALELRGPPAPRAAILRGSLALGLGLLLAYANVDGVWTYRIHEIDVNTARLELEAGKVEEGLARLEAALRANPTDIAGWLELTAALEQRGRIKQANRAWRQALRASPGDEQLTREATRFAERHPE